MRRPSLVGGLVFAALVAGPVHAGAQAVLTGTISGLVQDATGAALPGAAITLTDAEKGISSDQVSGREGTFRFVSVAIGNRYQLRAELQGFRPSIVSDIRVLPGYNQKFTLTMELGSVSEELTVIASAPLVATDSSVTSETLSANVVNELPLYSRNKTEVATLMPGTSFSRSESPGAWYEFHVRGDSTVAHGYRVDGATTIMGHGRTALSVPQNSVERFEFIPGGFQAEYGEQTGGMVNVITKTGTNQVHGAYDALFRPEAFASTVKSGIPGQVNDKQPGNTVFHEVSIGGPIVRDKLWFHTAIQYWQDDRGNLLQPTVLSAKFYNLHGKFTFQPSANDRWDASVEYDPFKQTNTTLQSNFAPEAQTYQDVSLYLANLQQSHVFNNNTTLQSQVYLHHLGQSSGGLNARNGGTVTAANYRPYVGNVTPQGTFFSGFRATRTNWSEYRLRVSEKLNLYRGGHNLKFGVDYAYLWGGRWANVFGSVYTDRRPLGGVLTRQIDIWPSPAFHWGDSDVAGYAQDSWAIRKRAVVDYGVRWDYQSEVGEHNVSPRLGLSVDPTGQGRSRAYVNFGYFYQNLWAFSWAYNRISRGSDLYRVDNPTGVFPNDPYRRALIGTDVLLNSFRTTIGDHYVNPHNVSWSIGYETALAWNLKVNANYSENRQHDWLFTLVAPSQFILQSDNCGVNPAVPKCGRYRGLELTLRKPFSNRFELLTAYTRSKATGISDLQGQQLTPAQLAAAYGPLDWDVPNVFNTTGMYELPGSMLVTGVVRYSTGRPYSITNAQVGTAVLYVDRQGQPSTRNAQRLRAQSSIDLGVQRAFHVGAYRLKAELQVLNLANRVNILVVQSNFAAAGTPTQVDFARQIQVGVGLTW